HKQEITYNVDMFRDTLKLLVETPKQQLIPPANFVYIQPFLKILGYQGSLDKVNAFFTKNLAQPWRTMFKKKNVIQYPHFTKLIIASLIDMYEPILKRLKEDYHIIKDDASLVNVYTTWEVTIQWMLIPNDLLTDAIHETQAYKDYEVKLEPESHKDNPKKIDDDDADGEKKDDKKDDNGKMEEMFKALRNKVPEHIVSTTNIPMMVTDAVNQERESFKAVIPALISKEFVAHAPKIIEEFFRIQMQIIVLNLHPTIKLILIFCSKVKMSRDVLTIGSTMRIPLLYRGEYSQWVERFMNYLEEQTDGEPMINSIKNGDQPLPRVTQVSIAGTSSTEQPPLKDKSMWSDQEKRIQKIDRLARSLQILGLPNDIYSLIDSNKTAKDLWDALARHMLGSEYGEQDRKAAVLYEYETFKATEGELLLDHHLEIYLVLAESSKLIPLYTSPHNPYTPEFHGLRQSTSHLVSASIG
nr:hypothetical protein [Tanacetum cinerariifolium]